MLMTPLTALAPHAVAPGPLMTSIRSMSSRSTSCSSQKTPANSGEYTVRPSISTSSLFARPLLKPRALMAHWLASSWSTSRLVASRRASGRRVAPERRISSRVMTWMADAVSDRCSGRRETELTSMAINCSRLIFFSAPGEGNVSGVCADALLARMSAPRAAWTGSSLATRLPPRGLGEGFVIG